MKRVRFTTSDQIIEVAGRGNHLPIPGDKLERPHKGFDYSHRAHSPLANATATRANKRPESLYAFQRGWQLPVDVGTFSPEHSGLEPTAARYRELQNRMSSETTHDSAVNGAGLLAGTWLLDSGASHHVVSKSNMSMQDVRSIHQGPPVTLSTANGRIYPHWAQCPVSWTS